METQTSPTQDHSNSTLTTAPPHLNRNQRRRWYHKQLKRQQRDHIAGDDSRKETKRIGTSSNNEDKQNENNAPDTTSQPLEPSQQRRRRHRNRNRHSKLPSNNVPSTPDKENINNTNNNNQVKSTPIVAWTDKSTSVSTTAPLTTQLSSPSPSILSSSPLLPSSSPPHDPHQQRRRQHRKRGQRRHKLEMNDEKQSPSSPPSNNPQSPFKSRQSSKLSSPSTLTNTTTTTTNNNNNNTSSAAPNQLEELLTRIHNLESELNRERAKNAPIASSSPLFPPLPPTSATISLSSVQSSSSTPAVSGWQPPPDAVPFVPLVLPEDPLEMARWNSGASSASEESSSEDDDENEEEEELSASDQHRRHERDEEEEDDDDDDDDDHDEVSARQSAQQAMDDAIELDNLQFTESQRQWFHQAQNGQINIDITAAEKGHLPPEVIAALERVEQSYSSDTSPSDSDRLLARQLNDYIKYYCLKSQQQQADWWQHRREQLDAFANGETLSDNDHNADDEDEHQEDIDDDENENDRTQSTLNQSNSQQEEEEEEEEEEEGEDEEEEQEEYAEEDDDNENDLSKFIKAQFKKKGDINTSKSNQSASSAPPGTGNLHSKSSQDNDNDVDQAGDELSQLSLSHNNNITLTDMEGSSVPPSAVTSPQLLASGSKTSVANNKDQHRTIPPGSVTTIEAAALTEQSHRQSVKSSSSTTPIAPKSPMHRAQAHKSPQHPHKTIALTSSLKPLDSSIDQDDNGVEEQEDVEVDEDLEPDDIEEDENTGGDEEESVRAQSNASSESNPDGGKDVFPYERNIFALCPSYHFIKRLYACDDAVTYQAISKITNELVAIKICDGYNGRNAPKEVRLLSSVQGHERMCVFYGWHPFPHTRAYAIITKFIHNVPIETIFDQPALHKVYMRHLLEGIKHMHDRGVLYRDVKPSNVLWQSEEQRAVFIDFDVGTYFEPQALHRSIVGTDGKKTRKRSERLM